MSAIRSRINRVQAALLAIVANCALGAGLSRAQTNDPPVPPLPEIERIVVRKADRAMDLYADGVRVYTITGLQLGDQPVGPKRFEGDERTPEGDFEIDYGNPDSAYHLSLHISYPRPQDVDYAAAQGRKPGGMIMIHGQPNYLPAGRLQGDWTDGCIAVSNAQIEALWRAVPDGTPVEIRP